MKKVLKNKKGFTLVELMVVVAILGVLVAVAVPAYNGVTESANKKVCATNIRTIESAILQAQVAGVELEDCTIGDGTTALDNYIKDAATLACPSDKGTPKKGYAFTASTGAVTCTHEPAHTKAAASAD